MERLSRVLASGLAVALMASVTLSVVAQGAGVDYWNDVVKGSKPMTYQDLNDGASGQNTTSGCTSLGYGFYEHVTTLQVGSTQICQRGSQAQHTLGNPSAGATSVMLTQDPTVWDSSAEILVHGLGPVASFSDTGGGALAVMVWTQFDACSVSGTHTARIGIVQLIANNQDLIGPAVYTDDCGSHLVLTDLEGGVRVYHTYPGPGTGRWFMTALVWHQVAGVGVLTWYTGYQGEGVVEHVATNANAPQWTGNTWGVGLGGNGSDGWRSVSPYQGGWTAEWWGLGTWQDANAVALLSPPEGNTGNAATWLGILNSFTPFSVKPSTGCVATTSGPQDCTSNPTQQPAPLSGSVKKFQIGYLPIVDCGAFPTIAVTFGITVTIPDPVAFVTWALCNATDVINMAVNALIFAANVAIDLAMPDGSGIAVWQKSQAEALTRFPYGYVTSAWNQLGSAMGVPGMGSYGCTGSAGGVSSCGYSGGSGSFTFSLHPGQQAGTVIDIPAELAVAGLGAYQGLMSAVVYGSFVLLLLRAARGELAGHPE